MASCCVISVSRPVPGSNTRFPPYLARRPTVNSLSLFSSLPLCRLIRVAMSSDSHAVPSSSNPVPAVLLDLLRNPVFAGFLKSLDPTAVPSQKPTAPLSELPRLHECTFEDAVRWHRAIDMYAAQHPECRLPCLAPLISAGVVDLVRIVTKIAVLPADPEELFKAIFASLRPSTAIDRLRALRAHRLASGPLGTHISTFCSFFKALEFPASSFRELFLESIDRCQVHAVVIAELKLDPTLGDDLESLTTLVVRCSHRLEEANSLTSVPAAPAVAHVLSSRPRSPPRTRLDETSRKTCMVDHLCFYCREPGHSIADCPQRLLRPTPPGASPSPSSAPLPAAALPPPVVLRHSSRPSVPPHRFDPSAPAAKVIATTLDLAVPDPRPHDNMILFPNPSVDGSYDVTGIIDTGSNITFSSPAMLRTIGCSGLDPPTLGDFATLPNGTRVPIVGSRKVLIQPSIARAPLPSTVYAIDDGPEDHIVIGCDFIVPNFVVVPGSDPPLRFRDPYLLGDFT